MSTSTRIVPGDVCGDLLCRVRVACESRVEFDSSPDRSKMLRERSDYRAQAPA